MHAQSFLDAIGSAQSAETRTLLTVGFGLVQQYHAIRDRGFDASVDTAALATLRAELDTLSPLDREVTALRAVADALPHWDASAANAFGRRLAYTTLLQYGQALFGRAAAKLAVTVLELVAVHAELDGEDGVSAQARLLCGFAWRTLGDWDASRQAYERAYELAWSAGELTIAIRTRVGLGYNASARGDLPGARALLRATATRAARLAPEALPYVYLAQANLESISGQYEEAVALCYRARQAAGADEEMQYASMVDLAQCLVDYGAPEVAEKALRAVLLADLDVRHKIQTKIHLLLLSATLRREADFVALRDDLVPAPFTVRQRALYQLYVAQGLRTFGKLDDARTAAETGLRVAREHSLFQLMFQAEEELRAIEAAASHAHRVREVAPEAAPVAAPRARMSRRLERIAGAISTMLEAPAAV